MRRRGSSPSGQPPAGRRARFVANPLRSLLTLLGIVIGVTTVVTMMALVEGLRTKVNHGSLAAGRQRLHASPSGRGGINFGRHRLEASTSAGRTSTLEDLRARAERCPSVTHRLGARPGRANKISTAVAETQPNVIVQGATAE